MNARIRVGITVGDPAGIGPEIARKIVIDPRVSDQAEVADLHLRITSGTDAALCLGWLNVIINERLYDEDFVAK